MADLNEIVFAEPKEIPRKIIEYIAKNAIKYNLFIVCESVEGYAFKDSLSPLKEKFTKTINGLSEEDRLNLSKISTVIRVQESLTGKKVIHGLLITFGKIPEPTKYVSTFNRHIERFISKIESTLVKGLIPYVTLPILNLGLLIYALRHNLSEFTQKDLNDEGIALLDLNSRSIGYYVNTPHVQKQHVIRQFSIETNNMNGNSVYLRVSKANLNIRYYEDIFSENSIGLTFTELKRRKKLLNNPFKRAIYARTSRGNLDPAKNVNMLSNTTVVHEAYWTVLFKNLLNEANIDFHIKEIQIDRDLRVLSNFVEDKHLWISNEMSGFNFKNIPIFDKAHNTIRYYESVNNTILDDVDDLFPSGDYLNQYSNSNEKIFFSQVDKMEEADLVIGKHINDKSWKTQSSLSLMDSYGKTRHSRTKRGKPNNKQFIDYETLKSKDALNRIVFELMLKQWINQEIFDCKVPVDIGPFQNELKYMVFGTKVYRQNKNKEQKSDSTNVFHYCFDAAVNKDRVTNKIVITHQNLKVIQIEKAYSEIKKAENGEKFDFEEYLSQLSHLDCFCERFCDLMDATNELEELKVGAFLRHNSSIIFEHDDSKFNAIWVVDNDLLWLQPELNNTNFDSTRFLDIVKKRLDMDAFTKIKGVSQIDQNVRRKPDPHYEIAIDSNSILINRLSYNQNFNTGIQRNLLRKATRIFPIGLIGYDDCEIILSNLLAPNMSQLKDSGTAQFLFEKIGKLAISD